MEMPATLLIRVLQHIHLIISTTPEDFDAIIAGNVWTCLADTGRCLTPACKPDFIHTSFHSHIEWIVGVKELFWRPAHPGNPWKKILVRTGLSFFKKKVSSDRRCKSQSHTGHFCSRDVNCLFNSQVAALFLYFVISVCDATCPVYAIGNLWTLTSVSGNQCTTRIEDISRKLLLFMLRR